MYLISCLYCKKGIGELRGRKKGRKKKDNEGIVFKHTLDITLGVSKGIDLDPLGKSRGNLSIDGKTDVTYRMVDSSFPEIAAVCFVMSSHR